MCIYYYYITGGRSLESQQITRGACWRSFNYCAMCTSVSVNLLHKSNVCMLLCAFLFYFLSVSTAISFAWIKKSRPRGRSCLYIGARKHQVPWSKIEPNAKSGKPTLQQSQRETYIYIYVLYNKLYTHFKKQQFAFTDLVTVNWLFGQPPRVHRT